MRGFFLLIFAASIAVGGSGCRRIEPRELSAVRAIRHKVEGGFQPPADGRITDAQIEMYLRVRRAAGRSGAEADAARRVHVEPGEFDWVRGRIVEALAALDARRVLQAGLESYSRAIATLREARRAAGDTQAAARMDAEIAAFERERGSLREPDPPMPSTAANAARIAPRREEIESVGP